MRVVIAPDLEAESFHSVSSARCLRYESIATRRSRNRAILASLCSGVKLIVVSPSRDLENVVGKFF
jgi:hypothetical protein